MIEPNLVVLGACVHSEDPSQFDVLAKNYMAPLANTLKEKPSLGASCFFFLGKQKKSM
jgi:hypothetical protein